MAAFEVVALDTATPQLRAPGAADTYTFPRAAAFSAAITYGGVTLSNSVTGTGSMVLSAAPTFTGTSIFRAANAIRSEAASTQDAVIVAGRAGGTSSFAVTLTPTTLSASRTLTLPDNSGTVLTTGAAVTVAQGGTGLTSGTSGGIPFFSSTSAMTS